MTQILSDVPLAYSEQKSQNFIFLALMGSGDMGLITRSRVVSSQQSWKNLSASYRHVWMKTHN